MIRAVILDCFGVLYVSTHEYLYQSLLVNPTVHHDEIRDAVRQCDYGIITRDELYKTIADLTDRSFEEVRQYLAKDFVRNDSLLAYVEALRPDRKVALLSNLGPSSIDQYFTAAEREKLFDVAVISSSIGMVKPHPGIFRYACEQLGVSPSEAVMIDDVEENCAGARAAGLQAIRYQSLAQTQDALRALL